MSQIRAFALAVAFLLTAAAAAQSPTVTLETDHGNVELEIYTDDAPISAANFLAYVDSGRYDGATFYRVVRPEHGSSDRPANQVVQGGLSGTELSGEAGEATDTLPPIGHETTETTGLRNQRGVIAWARLEPGTASSEFFFNLKDNPSLDTGDVSRQPDGQGYATFGRVTSGIDVLEKIQGLPTADEAAMPALRGQLLVEPVTILSARRSGGPYKAAPGPHAVDVREGRWTDADRDGRVVPYRLYLPREAGPVPVVVWSHGAGGSRAGAEYLGRHLASHGYACFHLQHAGSDSAVLREHGVQGMLQRMRNPEVSVARFGDVPFAVEQIRALGAEGDLAGRLDTERLGMSGHSFGAITTQAAAGQIFPGVDQNYSVDAFLGAFPMSPSPPQRGSAEAAFASMKMPIFHLTGSNDAIPIGDLQPEDRTRPFEIITEVDQYLLVLGDGIHSTFSGRRIPASAGAAAENDPRHKRLIKMAATAFWDSLLSRDEAVRATATRWLREGGMASQLADSDRFESKTAE
ncbi:MAG: peptidylprolyl isomerase [Acidobacteriota bacterium]